jgi:hypothetical protein
MTNQGVVPVSGLEVEIGIGWPDWMSVNPIDTGAPRRHHGLPARNARSLPAKPTVAKVGSGPLGSGPARGKARGS